MTEGNMFAWLDDNYNPVRGCSQGCSYCWVPKMRGLTHEFTIGNVRSNLGSGKNIGVCLTGDLFCSEMPHTWIKMVLISLELNNAINDAKGLPLNTFYLQTKNPSNMENYVPCGYMPQNCYEGVTIETNRSYPIYKNCRTPEERFKAFRDMQGTGQYFVTIEPIMDFDLDIFAEWFKALDLQFVNIGADSKKCGLPEPSGNQVLDLISELSRMVPLIRLKSNLSRIIGNDYFREGEREVCIGQKGLTYIEFIGRKLYLDVYADMFKKLTGVDA